MPRALNILPCQAFEIQQGYYATEVHCCLIRLLVSLHTRVDPFGQFLNVLAAAFAVHMTVVHVLNVLVKHGDRVG
jgi:hypothetical protein